MLCSGDYVEKNVSPKFVVWTAGTQSAAEVQSHQQETEEFRPAVPEQKPDSKQGLRGEKLKDKAGA